MEVKATLSDIRMAPRKVRLAANLIKGMSATRAQAQLAFLVRKPATFILKLVRSAVANAKQNFDIAEDNLFVKSIVVEGGATLKRWMPRAMGRASAIRKRTCSVKLILEEIKPGSGKKKSSPKVEVLKADEVLPEKQEKGKKLDEQAKESKPKGVAPEKPHNASSESKQKNFSRQTIGNIKKVFRRKSI
ncbi:MAG TPA: 50S ribosomal protein L22 [Candidatus Portnoybacteria bacterium]|nr:50S ribosomal protein L22 [Candidatus Portnoybacteria bacterium]